jgi:two-component system, cell cycle sensor histidine kinase and response regulator CckA
VSASHDSDVEQRLLDLVNEGVALGGLDGSILRVNEAACRIAGLSEADLLKRSWWDLVEPADRDAVSGRLEELVSVGHTGEPFRFRLVRPDRSHRWLDVTATVDRAHGLLLVLARDVTGRHVMDLERLMASFTHAALGMALVDHEGRFVRVNETLCALLNVPFEELRGRHIASIVAGDPRRWRGEALRRGEEASFQDELRLRRAGGGEIVALVSGTLVADSGGRPQYYVCQVLDMTARHEALEALAANEAKLAEAQQIAGLGSWEWDLARDQVTWSVELRRMLGLAHEAATGRPEAHLELLHPDDRARVARVVEAAVAALRPWSVDFRIVRPDGTLGMIHGRGEVVAGADGRAAVVHGTCQDVTDRRRVEDALRATEQLFRRAFDDAPIGMALIDLDGRWLRLNPALTQMLGRDEDELRVTRLDDLSHPEDRELDRPLIRDLLAGRRRAYAIEKRFRHADGRVIHALAHVSLMHGDGERPLYFLCQLVDLTERRRAEAERRTGEQRLRAIVDNSPALIIVKDLEHRYLLVNRRWEELYGVRAEHAVGRTSAEVLLDEVRPDHQALDEEVARTGEPLEAMRELIGPEGDELTMLLVKFPLLDSDGRLSAVCTIGTDLTERRRSAEELSELEHRLAQAQRLESVGQLAGGVAHDFNNLLSVILTCVGFARRELPAGHPVREDVDEIGRAADRAAALTRQLLMFSRREVVRPALLDVGALVAELEHLLARTLNERIDLRIDIEPGADPVLADRAQLEQVLVNLAVNARDAMSDGGTLTIAAAPAADGVRVTVADDGAGMSADVRDRAFEPFFTTKPPGEGTGLGLATVHGVVTDSGGTVEIASAPGAGTTVTVWLPGTREPGPVAEEPPVPDEPAVRSERVLVVEDQDPVRRQACRILEEVGFTVREAAGAEEALAAWTPVDVLVTDVVMPGTTGTDLAQQARERNPDLRVVLMSGHTEDVIVRSGARAGSLAFLQKPFTRETLLAAVDDALAAPAGAEW